jgi:hypothetical protein
MVGDQHEGNQVLKHAQCFAVHLIALIDQPKADMRKATKPLLYYFLWLIAREETDF